MHCTGKSFSEGLILESVNPQYDERLFIEFSEKEKFATYFVHNMMYFSRNSMNNLLSYCGLIDTRMSASEKDVPLLHYITVLLLLPATAQSSTSGKPKTSYLPL